MGSENDCKRVLGIALGLDKALFESFVSHISLNFSQLEVVQPQLIFSKFRVFCLHLQFAIIRRLLGSTSLASLLQVKHNQL